jgi:hypothetical protein
MSTLASPPRIGTAHFTLTGLQVAREESARLVAVLARPCACCRCRLADSRNSDGCIDFGQPKDDTAEADMTAAAKPIPEGYHSVTPYLILSGASDAIAFYKKALGAEEVMRLADPGGKVHYAEVKIGDSRIMLADEHFELQALSPKTVGGSPVSIHLYVADVDAAVESGPLRREQSSSGGWLISFTVIASAGSRTRLVIAGLSPRTRKI